MEDCQNANYYVGNEIICSAEVLKSNLCNFNDGYFLVTGDIAILGRNAANQVAFKNYASFTKCITKIDGIVIGDVEDLHLVLLMHNLLEYSSNYSNMTGILWFYSKDGATSFNADIMNNDAFKSLMYKGKLLGDTEADGANGILGNTTIKVSR